MATLTVYPYPKDASATTFDGRIARQGQNQTLTNLRAGTGDAASDVGQTGTLILEGSGTTDQFGVLSRLKFLFDTSSLTAGATITAATLSFGSNQKSNTIGSPDVVVVSTTTASDTASGTGDFDQATIGSTELATRITYADWATGAGASNDFALNASGIANINKTGISKFALLLSWDFDNSFTGTWIADTGSQFTIIMADANPGFTYPTLVVTYAAATTTSTSSTSSSISTSSTSSSISTSQSTSSSVSTSSTSSSISTSISTSTSSTSSSISTSQSTSQSTSISTSSTSSSISTSQSTSLSTSMSTSTTLIEYNVIPRATIKPLRLWNN